MHTVLYSKKIIAKTIEQPFIPFFDIKVTLGKTFNAYEAKIIYLLVLFAKDIPGNR